MSKTPMVGDIACQHEAYLIKALSAYKTGERSNADMQAIANKLTDNDIENVATYYSSMTCRVRKPKRDTDR